MPSRVQQAGSYLRVLVHPSYFCQAVYGSDLVYPAAGVGMRVSPPPSWPSPEIRHRAVSIVTSHALTACMDLLDQQKRYQRAFWLCTASGISSTSPHLLTIPVELQNTGSGLPARL